MLKEQPGCQLCVIKAPLQKTGKNKFNIFFFFFLHVFIGVTVYFSLLPCKFNKNNGYFILCIEL